MMKQSMTKAIGNKMQREMSRMYDGLVGPKPLP
jgi:hypothetical protein